MQTCNKRTPEAISLDVSFPKLTTVHEQKGLGYIRFPYEPGVLGVWRKTPKKNFVILRKLLRKCDFEITEKK